MHKVIFDTDPGVDDAMALLFLHRHPQVQLLGVTTVFGNAAIETTTRNALFLCEAFGIDAPVARGAGVTFDPTRPTGPFPDMIHGVNGLGDIPLTDPIRRPDPLDAADFIIQTLRRNPGEVSLIAVGRMTNLAEALRRDPHIASLVKDVTIMGGAFFEPGNVSPAAEANIHGDPEAADLVLGAAWKVAVIGLDVTTTTAMTRGELAELAKTGGPAVELLNDLSQRYIDFYGHYLPEAMLVHDTCACAYVVAPELFQMAQGQMRVVCGGIADGQTILKPHGRHFPPGPWDHRPVQKAAIRAKVAPLMALIHRTLGG